MLTPRERELLLQLETPPEEPVRILPPDFVQVPVTE